MLVCTHVATATNFALCRNLLIFTLFRTTWTLHARGYKGDFSGNLSSRIFSLDPQCVAYTVADYEIYIFVTFLNSDIRQSGDCQMGPASSLFAADASADASESADAPAEVLTCILHWV
jgi:hypothetical protein